MGVLKVIANGISKHAPVMLVTGAAVGVGVTIMLTFKVAPVADKILQEHKMKMEEIPKEEKESRKQEIKEFIKKEAPVIAPVLIAGAATVICIFGAHSIHVRRQTALALAYNLTEQTFKDYREKTAEALGPKKEKALRDEINSERVYNDLPQDEMIIDTGLGHILWYDPWSGRYFRASVESVQKIENLLNRRMLVAPEMYVSVNDLYELLNIDRTKVGDLLGWNADNGNVEIGHTVVDTPFDEPCYVMDYNIEPRFDYAKLY